MIIEKSELTFALITKLGVVAIILLFLPLLSATLAALAITICYRYVIAAFFRIKVMSVMDMNTFITNDKAPLNCVNLTPVSSHSNEITYEVFGRLVKAHLKMRSKIVKVFGDYYYKEMDYDEVL